LYHLKDEMSFHAVIHLHISILNFGNNLDLLPKLS